GQCGATAGLPAGAGPHPALRHRHGPVEPPVRCDPRGPRPKGAADVSTPLIAGEETAESVGALAPPGKGQRKPATGLLVAGLCLIGIVVVASVIALFVLPNPNQQDLLNTLQPPSADHLFGTDDLGRDVLSRTLAGTWIDLPFGLFVTALGVFLGVIVGSTAGYIGGRFERVVMRITDAVVAFPFLV